jgi:hypothetical protein
MSKLVSRANGVLAVAIIWLVIVFSCYFFNVASPGLGTKWVQLQPLPEPAAAIELTRFGYVLATTDSGQSYKVYLWQDSEPWTLYDEATEEFYGEPCAADDGSRFTIPSPPGNVVMRSSGNCAVSAETWVRAEVALLENGEVWLWAHSYGGAGEAYLSLLLFAAGALGVVILLAGIGLKFYDAE